MWPTPATSRAGCWTPRELMLHSPNATVRVVVQNRLTIWRATKLGLLDLKRHLFLGLGVTLCDADTDLIRSQGEFVCGQISDVRNAAVW